MTRFTYHEDTSSIGFYGFGFEVQSVLKFFSENQEWYLKKRPQLIVYDEKVFSAPALTTLQQLKLKLPSLHWISANGEIESEAIEQLAATEVLYRSPGISPRNSFLENYRRKGKKVLTHSQLFCDLCPAPIVAITGSNGKTTSSYLIFELIADLVKAQNNTNKVWLCGNMGLSGLDHWDQISPKDFVVMELSSFQLQDLQHSFDISVILNITPNHLDYHADLDEYQRAKWRIAQFQKQENITLLNPKTPFLLQNSTELDSQTYFIGEPFVDQIIKQASINFITHPQNLQASVLTAFLLGRDRLGLSEQEMTPLLLKTLSQFKGLPHRLEYVGTQKKVKFYNDSEATTPEAATFAVEQFAPGSAIFLIGGVDKGVDFKPLARACVLRKMTVLCYGKLAETFFQNYQSEMAHLLEENLISEFEQSIASTKIIKMGSHFPEIFDMACKIASENQNQLDLEKPSQNNEGMNIVLSPAGSSFDMFKNVYHRGDTFRELAQKKCST